MREEPAKFDWVNRLKGMTLNRQYKTFKGMNQNVQENYVSLKKREKSIHGLLKK